MIELQARLDGAPMDELILEANSRAWERGDGILHLGGGHHRTETDVWAQLHPELVVEGEGPLRTFIDTPNTVTVGDDSTLRGLTVQSSAEVGIRQLAKARIEDVHVHGAVYGIGVEKDHNVLRDVKATGNQDGIRMLEGATYGNQRWDNVDVMSNQRAGLSVAPTAMLDSSVVTHMQFGLSQVGIWLDAWGGQRNRGAIGLTDFVGCWFEDIQARFIHDAGDWNAGTGRELNEPTWIGTRMGPLRAPSAWSVGVWWMEKWTIVAGGTGSWTEPGTAGVFRTHHAANWLWDRQWYAEDEVAAKGKQLVSFV